MEQRIRNEQKPGKINERVLQDIKMIMDLDFLPIQV